MDGAGGLDVTAPPVDVASNSAKKKGRRGVTSGPSCAGDMGHEPPRAEVRHRALRAKAGSASQERPPLPDRAVNVGMHGVAWRLLYGFGRSLVGSRGSGTVWRYCPMTITLGRHGRRQFVRILPLSHPLPSIGVLQSHSADVIVRGGGGLGAAFVGPLSVLIRAATAGRGSGRTGGVRFSHPRPQCRRLLGGC